LFGKNLFPMMPFGSNSRGALLIVYIGLMKFLAQSSIGGLIDLSYDLRSSPEKGRRESSRESSFFIMIMVSLLHEYL